MTIRAVFEYDPIDHYQAARAVTRLTPARYVGWAMVAVAIGMLVWAVVPNWGEYPAATLFWSGLPWLLLAVFWLTVIPLMQRRAASKLPMRDASVVGPQERIVDGEGYHSRGNGVALDVPWHAMARAVETEREFLFFYNRQCAYYLPKRVLSPEQVAGVRELMRSALGARAHLQAA